MTINMTTDRIYPQETEDDKTPLLGEEQVDKTLESIRPSISMQVSNEITGYFVAGLAVTLHHRLTFPQCRHILAVMAFLGFVNVYCLRVNLSVALVAMVNSSQQAAVNSTEDVCPGELANSTQHSVTSSGEFNWDSNLQALVLGAFFYGYITTQIPGGWLGERFGGKKLFGFGVLCTAVLTLITPFAARLNVYLFIAVRVLEGIGEGVTFPACHALLAKWAPPYERSKLGTFIYAGATFGTVFSLPISGVLCAHGFAGGWPSVFYLFGSLGCVWFIFWMFLCYDSPAEHPRISTFEREFIECTIGTKDTKQPTTPWLSIIKSRPFWAVAVAHFCNNWGFYTLLTCLPTYMKEVLKFDLSQNGVLSGLPYFVMWAMMISGGQLADTLRKRGILSTTKVRKMFNIFGLTCPAIALIAAGYLGCDTALAVVMLTIAVGTSGLAMSGYGVNHLDLAPPHAGTLMGLTNALATIPGFAGPAVVGALTHSDPSRGQWRIVFFISSGIYLFGMIFYTIFGSGIEQDWSREGLSQDPRVFADVVVENDSDNEYYNHPNPQQTRETIQS